MIAWTFKFFFGKVIGLDKIPADKKDRFVKEVAVPILKSAVQSAIASGGKEVMVKFKKAF